MALLAPGGLCGAVVYGVPALLRAVLINSDLRLECRETATRSFKWEREVSGSGRGLWERKRALGLWDPS